MGVFFDRLKLCSTVALDCRTGQNKGRCREKELSFLIVSLSVSIIVMFTILNVPAVVDGRGSLSSHMRHLANEACHTVRLFKQSSSICSYLRNGLILHACMYNLL